VLSGPLRIVASENIGALGPRESPPAFVEWHWHYHLSGLWVWALPLVLLVALPENRSRQAWMILIPLSVLAAFVWPLIVGLLSMRSDDSVRYGIQFDALIASWAVVWLLGVRLSRWHGMLSFSMALAVMLLVGAASGCLRFGFWSRFQFIEYAVPVAALVLAMSLSACCCRRAFRPVRFLAWLAFWVVLGVLAGLAAEVVYVLARGDVEFSRIADYWGRLAVKLSVAALCLGGILYVINLPFMVLAFKCPVYRDRFHAVLRLPKDQDGSALAMQDSGTA
jgi:hypothetical protein